MKIQVEKNNTVAVVTLEGEVNFDNSTQLRAAFQEITREGFNKVIVDFQSVEFIDSAGLAALIEMVQSLKNRHGKLSLCNVNKKIIGIFEITKVHKLMGIYEDIETALANL